jgi:hypothetical protein
VAYGYARDGLVRGAKLLVAWLKKHDVGHNELGRRLGFSAGSDFVSKIVNGQRSPGLRAALLFERECNIPPSAWLKTPLHIAA